jgi:NAD(P)H-dependent FMN reductase
VLHASSPNEVYIVRAFLARLAAAAQTKGQRERLELYARLMSDPGERIRIGVILASTRRGRRGEAFAKWILELVAARDGVAAELVDLRDYRLPAYEYEQMPKALETSYGDEAARAWYEKIHALDGYVIVTPEYNRGYPGQLKNAIDHLQVAWWYKPVGFVSYGGSASGARAVDQLRVVACEVRMVPVRGEVNIRLIGLVTDDQGRPTEPLYPRLAGAMIDQLLWWGRAAKRAKSVEPPPG